MSERTNGVARPIRKITLSRETIRDLRVRASIRTGTNGVQPPGDTQDVHCRSGIPILCHHTSE